MSPNISIRTGVALSITVGVAYAACSVFFWLWPEAGVTIANALFHGLDFRMLRSGAALFDFTGFAAALAVLMAWTFVLGTLFGWLRSSDVTR